MPKRARKTSAVSVSSRGGTQAPVIRDVRQLAAYPRSVTRPRAVALDLATNTGLAFAEFDPHGPINRESLSPIFLGQLDLSAAQYESGAIRFVRLIKALEELRPSIIFYEQVRFTPSGPINKTTIGQVMARTYSTAELIGGFKATVNLYAERNGVPCCGLSIGEIKRRASGHGNCSKEDMILACNEYFGTDFAVEGYESSGVDNVADAAWILVQGLELYAAGVQFDTLPIDLSRVASEDLRRELESPARRQGAEDGGGTSGAGTDTGDPGGQ